MSIELPYSRYEEIKTSAANMFEKLKISCVPINAFEIACKLGVKITPYSAYKSKVRQLLLKKSEDGFAMQEQNGQWYIFYNDEKNYGRINNTIMHEIGHIVLDHTEDSELAEKEVNFFAKYALAPPVLIYKFALESPESIMRMFEVSHEAATYAYSYYQKWKKVYCGEYTNYEKTIVSLFYDKTC